MEQANVTDKMLERIRKLLAMGEGNANPHEAEIAMRRANKLLEEYNLDRADVVLNDPSVLRFGTAEGETAYRAMPKWACILGPAIAQLYSCNVNYGFNRNSEKTMCFAGEESDSKVAAWTFDYLVTQINFAAEDHRRRTYGVGRKAMTDFRYSAALALVQKMRQMVAERDAQKSTGTDLVICKKALVEGKYGTVKYVKVKGRERNEAGYNAGANIDWRAGVADRSESRYALA